MAFTYQGATIRAHELTIGDDEDLPALCQAISGQGEYLYKHTWFAEYQLAAEVEGGEPIARVTAQSTPEQIQAAYAQWRHLPRSFRNHWRDELARAEQPAPNPSASSS